MGLSVNTNIAALDAYRNLSSTQTSLQSSLQKLSSGYRINKAGDDSAGLAISEGLKSQVSGLTQAARNAQDGINVVQTADGALTEVQSILHRMRDLAVQSANDSNSTNSRADLQTEYKQLDDELKRIGTSTNFNGTKLLQGGTTSLYFQVGANGTSDNQIKVSLGSINISTVATALSTVSLTSVAGATKALAKIDAQIQSVSTGRAALGAYENRFQHTINSLNVAVENLSASESQITDTDMASEMVNFTRAQILSQAGTSMLAQANSIPQTVLKLLQ